MQPWKKSITFKIENEFDLHVKVVSFIRKFYSNAIISAGLGELQDTQWKRINSWKKGYTKGQPDIIIHNLNINYTGFVLEFKTPLGNGILSKAQEKLLERYSENGYKVLISNDYELIINEIINYMQSVRIKCPYCNKVFKNSQTLMNHDNYFHRITIAVQL